MNLREERGLWLWRRGIKRGKLKRVWIEDLEERTMVEWGRMVLNVFRCVENVFGCVENVFGCVKGQSGLVLSIYPF